MTVAQPAAAETRHSQTTARAIDVGTLVTTMVQAASKTVTKKQWTGMRDYAEEAFKKIAEDIAFIEAQRIAGAMTEEQAVKWL